MRTTLATISIIVACVTLTAKGSEGRHTHLTTNILAQTSAATEKAANNQNSEVLLHHMVSNVVISISFPENPEYPAVTFTKAEYAEHLRYTWSSARDFSCQTLSTTYNIAPDGQSATATSSFSQSATLTATGQTFNSIAQQVATIELIDGIPMATRIKSTVIFK
jgi:hypothetical protein